jgi:hypothetical protein
MYRPQFPSLSPELDAIDSQMMLTVPTDPNQYANLQNAYAEAKNQLSTVDHSNIPFYTNVMTRVLLLNKQLTSNITMDQLMIQKKNILENMISQIDLNNP